MICDLEFEYIRRYESWKPDPMKIGDRRYLNLLREMALAQFKLRDQSTFFGFLWSFLNPLIALGLLFVLFRSKLGVDVEHYGVYLLIGIIHYSHFSNATTASMNVLCSMRSLTRNADIPQGGAGARFYPHQYHRVFPVHAYLPGDRPAVGSQPDRRHRRVALCVYLATHVDSMGFLSFVELVYLRARSCARLSSVSETPFLRNADLLRVFVCR